MVSFHFLCSFIHSFIHSSSLLLITFWSPLEATRIRLVSQPTFANGLVGGFLRLFREEGVLRGFYSGNQLKISMIWYVFERVSHDWFWFFFKKKVLVPFSSSKSLILKPNLLSTSLFLKQFIEPFQPQRMNFRMLQLQVNNAP
jgi:hypothetical protein